MGLTNEIVLLRSSSAISVLRHRAAFPAHLECAFRAVHFLSIHRPHRTADNGFAIRQFADNIDMGLIIKITNGDPAAVTDLAHNIRRIDGFFIAMHPIHAHDGFTFYSGWAVFKATRDHDRNAIHGDIRRTRQAV
ncbi:conserved hypothetical protein [Yersinia pestis Pestoides F]|uniref:Uncharacterized protein n=2 Tax=Yersinia pestis TaxID=632 RepID=Q8CKS6_YERPE|nr:hypothetical [Yersinia pestis KIM10+]ABG19061.1 conserved hypothetical protein [Yersinia pestis Nepal516]ABP40825.1 conserved hypothetical protein [Yersinia pestis Pestoides F]